jgi:excinuclease UvrABC ATPase subunit
VVEHEEVIGCADYVIDIGPGAGTRADRSCSAAVWKAGRRTMTGHMFGGEREIPAEAHRLHRVKDAAFTT